jgi:hypothetical protein
MPWRPCGNCGGINHYKRDCKYTGPSERKSLTSEILKKRIAPATMRGRAIILVQYLALKWNLPIEIQNRIEFHCHRIESRDIMNVFHSISRWGLWRTKLLKAYDCQSVEYLDAIDGLPDSQISTGYGRNVPIPAGRPYWQRRQWPLHRTPINFGGFKYVAASGSFKHVVPVTNSPIVTTYSPWDARCYAEPTSTGFKLTYLHAGKHPRPAPDVRAPEMLEAFRHNFETWRKLN